MDANTGAAMPEGTSSPHPATNCTVKPPLSLSAVGNTAANWRAPLYCWVTKNDPYAGINLALVKPDKAGADPQLHGHRLIMIKAKVSPQYQCRATLYSFGSFQHTYQPSSSLAAAQDKARTYLVYFSAFLLHSCNKSNTNLSKHLIRNPKK